MPIPIVGDPSTPLIYRAVPAWFVRVEKIREKWWKTTKAFTGFLKRLVKKDLEIGWQMLAIGTSRGIDFGEHQYLFGNVRIVVLFVVLVLFQNWNNVLERRSMIFILIRSIIWKYSVTVVPLCRRIEDVFDCWFESGSMPYAQDHYPFENKEVFEKKNYPAQFIAEGLDQTRGWFYTLLVLSATLFDKPPFQNVIVNGMVLAEDGSKMSKSKTELSTTKQCFG